MDQTLMLISALGSGIVALIVVHRAIMRGAPSKNDTAIMRFALAIFLIAMIGGIVLA